MTQQTIKPSRIRHQITDVVAGITPLDELEAQHQRESLQWIASDADLFRIEKPDVPSKHLVSYFLLYDKDNESVLLVDHKSAGLWLPSGGHVEVDEHPRKTVERESAEELDLAATFLLDEPLLITATKTVNTDRPHIDVSLWYVLEGHENMPLHWDQREFNGVRWWKLSNIKSQKSGFDPHMFRFVQKLEQTI